MSERVTTDMLAEVEALDREATPDLFYQAIPDGGFMIGATSEEEEAHADDEPQIGWCEREEDAKALVRMRTLGPLLAAEVRRLTEDNKAYASSVRALVEIRDALREKARAVLLLPYGTRLDELRAEVEKP